MKYCIVIIAFLFLSSCNSGGGSASSVAAETANLDGYVTTNMSGSAAILSEKKDGAGNLTESGYTSGDRKNGTWVTYHSEGGRIETITSYTDGQLNGPSLTFDTRGQVIGKKEYRSGVFHGEVVTYKFGRVEKSTPYVNGQKHGIYEEYNSKGNLQRQIEFKNDVQDGALKYFDEAGNITVEYMYKNGEKVSGGIVE